MKLETLIEKIQEDRVDSFIRRLKSSKILLCFQLEMLYSFYPLFEFLNNMPYILLTVVGILFTICSAAIVPTKT